ncbi:MAG: iron-sulfur cluster assembly accessory protein [Nanoarchaeota archaeon]|nr:iron-sulfur cluster assembly accessory protein [Nanoarchaeota archaeon]MBU1269679.1 iron-sulfur cluster assembly accessory protein [Nanoarchaeota archaeon]MBU1604101.1 iron-sulfur cluster assembly accessory protein [Nanoarchaeota archaeon]MBU2443607.1 iron-sulfur cluster assembly accessory protein [Nanoarchaeota archaeon]
MVKKAIKKEVKKQDSKKRSSNKQKQQTLLITKDMTLGEVIGLYPETINILLEEGIHCVGCGAANWETVEQGLFAHGRTQKEVDAIVKQLNTVALKQESKRDPQSVVFTDAALKEIKSLLKKEKKEGFGLRIEVRTSGCCGPEYKMDFDNKRDKDVVIQLKGLKVYVDSKSMNILKGSIVDYINTPAGSGFKIDNPSIQQSSGSCHS